MALLDIDRNTRLRYVHAPGTRAETFVFCNHMGGGADTWEERIAPQLRAAGYGTLTFDYRAQGETEDRGDEPIPAEVIVSDICRLLAGIDPSRPVLVGQSIGGLFAARACLEGAPAAGLILMNTLRIAGPRTEWIAEVEDRLLSLGGTDLLFDTLQPMLTGIDGLARLRSDHLTSARYAALPTNAPRRRLAAAARDADWNMPYERLTLPVLVLTGRKDRLFRVQDDVDRLLARMPDARQVMFGDAGHALYFDQPERLIIELAEFASRIASGSNDLDVTGPAVAPDATTDRFEAEEVPSTYGYLSGYEAPRPIEEQIEALTQAFPDLGSAAVAIADRALPEGAEGYFTVPRPECVAASYNDAFHAVLRLLAESRDGRFYNNRNGQTGPEGMRPHADTVAALERIGAEQAGHDILVIPAQFALRHRGRSVRRARAVFRNSEFGLGAFHVGAMLLTHPQRLQQYNDLYVDCPGDEFDDKAADNRFGRTPCFCYEHEQLEFGTHWTDRVYDFNGSASAFLS